MNRFRQEQPSPYGAVSGAGPARGAEAPGGRLLARAAGLLRASTDSPAMAAALLALAVPELADASLLVLQGGSELRVAACSHPHRLDLSGSQLPSDCWLAELVRADGPALASPRDDDDLRRVAGSQPALYGALAALAPCSCLGVPLRARKDAGALLLVRAGGSRPFRLADLELGEQLRQLAEAALDATTLHAETQHRRQSAEAANRTKSDFLAVISHELRTPLTGIMGYAELLAEQVSGPISEVQRWQLERIQGGARHLLSLIEQILLFARIEAGHEELRREATDIRSLVQETVAMLLGQAAAAGLTLAAAVPGEPLHTVTDRGKVRQVLINLVGNALKFTTAGGVYISCEGGASQVVIRVRDTGPGIPAEHQALLFEPFRRAGGTLASPSGTGLGLAVSRHLAELLGGSLELEQTSSAGTTFCLALPANSA